METLRLITKALQPEEFLTSVGLTDTYFLVPIFPAHRRFLWFYVGRFHLQFRVLPFGLSIAPVFLNILINPVIRLREESIHIHAYLDNLLSRSSFKAK